MSKVDFGDEFYREHLRKVFKRMQDAYQYQEICNLYDGDCEIVLAYIFQLETQNEKLENKIKNLSKELEWVTYHNKSLNDEVDYLYKKKNKATADKARR